MKSKKLILLMGLPRSGKSTWARKHGAPVVNIDSIRLAIHGQVFRSEVEPLVWAQARIMAEALLRAGHDEVIIDATNTTRARREFWFMDHSYWNSIDLVVIHTNVELCRQRAKDTGCENLIPIINRMFEQWEVVDESEGFSAVKTIGGAP